MTLTKKIILIILFGLSLCGIYFVAIDKEEVIYATPQETFSDNESYIPANLVDFQLPTQWWVEDGYEDLDSWWKDLLKIWDETGGMTDTAIEECGQYLNSKKEEQLANLEYDILHCYSVKECKAMIEEFDQIIINSLPRITYSAPSVEYNYDGNYTTSDFVWMGVIKENGWKYTWYSQKVLPGGGLSIPGRHVGSDNLVHDADGYIVVAANQKDLKYGDTVDTPFGPGKVYDTGCAEGTIDIYSNF